jgi:hypothetical protein
VPAKAGMAATAASEVTAVAARTFFIGRFLRGMGLD